MMPHNTYSITIHMRTMTIAKIRHKKRCTIPLSNKQYSKEHDAIIQLCQNLLCDLSSDINNTPKMNISGLKDTSIN